MPRPLKCSILSAGTIFLSQDINNYILCVVQILMNQTLAHRTNYCKVVTTSMSFLEAHVGFYQIAFEWKIEYLFTITFLRIN